MNSYTEKLKLSDQSRNFKWINEQNEAGLLKIGGNKPTKEVFKQFRLFTKTTEDVYSNHWDFDLEVQKLTSGDEREVVNIIGIIIYFPEVDMNNSRVDKHTIKDMFVKICFKSMSSPSRLVISDICGGRATVSYAEFTSGYLHSHLTNINYTAALADGLEPPFWRSFCTGSGEINRYKMDLNGDGITEERLIKLLLQIYVLISWESIEGTPYAYIKEIRIQGGNNMPRSVVPSIGYLTTFYSKIKERFIEKGLTPHLEFAIESNQEITVVDSPLLDNLILDYPLTTEEKKRFLFRKNIGGTTLNQYINYVDSATPIPLGRLTKAPIFENYFIFRGEKAIFKVEENPLYEGEKEDTKEIEYFVHPTTRTQLKTLIEHEVNINKIRKSTIERYRSTNDTTRESSEPDKVSM